MVIKHRHSFGLSSAILCALAAVAPADAQQAKRDVQGEAQLAKLLAGRVAGKPSDCIDERFSDDIQVIDHTAIVYRDGRTLWVNRPKGNLDALDYNSILVTKRFASQLCSIDPVHLVDRTSRFERGFVSLGTFVPYTKTR